MLVLDTHILLWWVNDKNELSTKASKAIDKIIKGKSNILISSISVWEISMLIRKNRLVLSIDIESWVKQVESIHNVRFYPVDNEISINSTTLPGEFHKDPADRIIVATARKFSAPLVTADEKILNYRHLKTIW